MHVIVFIGPTISASEVMAVVDAECRPPAAQGDVYLAAQEAPDAIGIVDGYFSGEAAIWHKEILWAISNGIPVYGASSMGALRAAELADFGMRGVGEVFESYRSGATEDDDEVAVLHAPAELGYMSLSEPMVNIRPTLARAASEGLIDSAALPQLLAVAKELHYHKRTWPHILEAADAGHLATWIDANRVDQKKLDAQELLRAMRADIEAGREGAAVQFTFEQTNAWEQGTRAWLSADSQRPDDQELAILDEALLDAGTRDWRKAAFDRLLALREAEALEMEADYAEQRQALNTFRVQRGLTRASDLSEWLDEHELTEDELSQLLVEELFVSDLFRADAPRLNAHVLDLLKLEGRYARLADRAEAKRITLERIGCSGSGQALEKSGLTPPDLLQWYFHQQQGEVPPVDIDAYIADRGVNSREQLYEILAREYLYLGSRTGED